MTKTIAKITKTDETLLFSKMKTFLEMILLLQTSNIRNHSPSINDNPFSIIKTISEITIQEPEITILQN